MNTVRSEKDSMGAIGVEFYSKDIIRLQAL